jgi:hypothetical protein
MIPPHLMPSCNLATPVFRAALRARWQAAAAAARIHGDAPQAAAGQGEGQQTGATGHVQDGAGGQGTDLGPAENGGE